MSQQGILEDTGGADSGIEKLTGNTGGAVGADGVDNVNVIGAAPITVTGSPGTNTLTVEGDGTLLETVTTDSGTATPAGDTLNVLGGTLMGTTGAGSTVTINANGSVSSNFPSDNGSGTPASNIFLLLGSTSTNFTESGIETHVGAAAQQMYFENRRYPSAFVVDAVTTVGTRGQYSTVQSAITAADAAGGGTVYIRPGVYTENLTMEANVNLVGLTSANGINVTIAGRHTIEYTGRADIENIQLLGTAGDIFVSTTGTLNLFVAKCLMRPSTGSVCGSANPDLQLFVEGSVIAPGNVNMFDMSDGLLTVFYSTISPFLGSSRPIVATGTASYFIEFNTGQFNLETQDTATIVAAHNTTNSFTTETINVNSANSTISLYENDIECNAVSGDFAIGTGTIAYAHTSLLGTATDINGTLTQTIFTSRPRSTAAASAGASIFGTCSFDSADFSVADGFVSLSGGTSDTYTTDSGNAVPAAGVLNILGGTAVITSGSGNTVTVTSTGAWELLSAQTASASADIQFTSGFSTTTSKYMCVIRNCNPATNTSFLLAEVSKDAGSTWLTTAYQSGVNYSSYSSATINNQNSTSFIRLSGPMSNLISNQSQFIFYFGPTNIGNQISSHGTGIWVDTTLSATAHGWFGGRGDTGINAIRFRMSSGNIANGEFSLYKIIA